MAFVVILQRRAQADITTAMAWPGWRDASATARWRDGLLAALGSLETDPNRYPQAEEAGDLGIDLRVMPYGKRRQVYRVLFSIVGETVFVHRVRHAAQDRLTGDDL